MTFLLPNEPMPMGAPETCPDNGALWASVWRTSDDGLRAYEMLSDSFWVFEDGRWKRYNG
jgi:hypothetical protein